MQQQWDAVQLCVCVCVCVRERERERMHVGECACVYAPVCVCLCVCLYLSGWAYRRGSTFFIRKDLLTILKGNKDAF